MFPNFFDFGKTSQFLLESDGWFGFIDNGLSSSGRKEMLARLLSTDPDIRGMAEKYVVSDSAASAFTESFKGWDTSIGKAVRHTERTTQENLRTYVRLLHALKESYRVSPTYSTYKLLQRHCEHHLPEIMHDILSGAHSDALTGSVLEMLRRGIVSAEDNIGESLDKEEMAKIHDKFSRALEKKFKLSVGRVEPLGVGVYLLLDQESHDELLTAIADDVRSVEDFAAEHGYILLKKGLQAEINYGNFPSSHSRWLFVYSPNESSDQGGVTVISKHKYAPVSLDDFET